MVVSDDAVLPTRLEIAPTTGGVVLSGEIDAHTAPTLAGWLAPLQGAGTDVLIDLAGVDFIDSSGLGVLIDAHRRAVDAGRRLVLERPSPAVVRLIEISGLRDHLTLWSE
jgi:anti-sigma B factor antagonist